MLTGYNQIGNQESGEGNQHLKAFSTIGLKHLEENFKIATRQELEQAVDKATLAFSEYKTINAFKRAEFLENIASEIDELGAALIARAMAETGLTEARLKGEKDRTTAQLKLFSNLLREGSWVDAVIDIAEPERKPMRRADLRKMNIPIGPVAVFGASNFPFAFSTAGGDTASALAAGNPVIVKASPSHLGTNEMIGAAILKAVQKSGMPDGVFSFLIGESETALQLVRNPGIKAVGFTGSYQAGMAIYRAAVNERETPIPVHAEMSSINPVLILPRKLSSSLDMLAEQLVASIALGAGQFCTSPGLIFLLTDIYTESFIGRTAKILAQTTDVAMLNSGIAKNYYASRKMIAGQKGVTAVYMGPDHSETYRSSPALLHTHAVDFIKNPQLQNEIFGPAALIVQCANQDELHSAVQSLHGQLTGTVMGDDSDIIQFSSIISVLMEKVGRVIFNGVPTGVEVSHAMVHGGPFPATTDVRTTSVGTEAIKRFVRPFCFQDCPSALLPEELKDENPANIMRMINGHFTREKIELPN